MIFNYALRRSLIFRCQMDGPFELQRVKIRECDGGYGSKVWYQLVLCIVESTARLRRRSVSNPALFALRDSLAESFLHAQTTHAGGDGSQGAVARGRQQENEGLENDGPWERSTDLRSASEVSKSRKGGARRFTSGGFLRSC